MGEYITFQRLCELLKSYETKRVVITFHTIGDRDSVSTAIALKRYLRDAVIVTPDYITSNARRLLDMINFKGDITNSFPAGREVLIILDSNNLDVLGKFADKVHGFMGDVLFIDHHYKPKSIEPNVMVFNDEGYNSTASIVYEALKSIRAGIDKSSALMLLYGIVSDSADFRNAFPLTFRQVSELLEKAEANYGEIIEEFKHHLPLEHRIALINDIVSSKSAMIGDYILMYGKASRHANAVAETAISLGADISLFWVSNEEVSISARLRPPLDKRFDMHLGAIMQDVGPIIDGTGGGHPAAAGAYGTNTERLQEAIDQIIKALRAKVR